ncbi:hypothetical protein ACTFIU_007212 [Dictyostelium citrinum]
MKIILSLFLILFFSTINLIKCEKEFKMLTLLTAQVDDLGFNNMINQGRIEVAKGMNIEDSRLLVVEGYNETFKHLLPIVQNDDIDLVICSSSGHLQACRAIAEMYINSATIKTQFLVRGSSQPTKNLIYISYNYASANYISGYFSALFSKTGKIGFVSPGAAANNNDSFVYAFWIGARQVNPNIKFYYYNIGNYLDVDKTVAATNDLLDMGCDVVGNTLDDFSTGDASIARGFPAIGTNGFPQRHVYGENVIYSYSYNWTKFFLPIAQSVKSGNTNNSQWYADFNFDENKNFFHLDYGFEVTQDILDKMNTEIDYLKRTDRLSHPYYCNDLIPQYANENGFKLVNVDNITLPIGCISHQTFLQINKPFPGMTYLGNYKIKLVEVEFSQSVQYGFSITTGVLIAIAIIMMIGIVKYKGTPSIRSASPIFLNFILAGGIIVYIGIIVWVGPASNHQCNARLWLVTLGFSTLIGSLVVKNFRIWLIFDNPELKSISITNYQLFPWVGACLVINIILMAILTSVGDLREIDAQGIDSLGKYEFMKVCKMNSAGASTLYTILAYFAALLLVGVFVSWKIRIVDIQEFNESKAIANTLYAISFCLFVIVPLMISPQDKQSETIVLCTAGLFITTAALLIVFTPKFWRVFTLGDGGTNDMFRKKQSNVATARAESSKSSSGPKLNRRGNLVSDDFTDTETSISEKKVNVVAGAVLAEFTDDTISEFDDNNIEQDNDEENNNKNNQLNEERVEEEKEQNNIQDKNQDE